MLDKNVLINILDLAKDENIVNLQDMVSRIKNPADLKKLVERGFISRNKDLFQISFSQKIRIAVELVRLGSTIFSVCRYLSWSEFERLVQYALRQNNYETILHLRLNLEQKRSEIDIVGIRGEVILCIDCKHWNYGNRKSALENAALLQLSRSDALAKNFSSINTRLSEKLTAGKVIPIIITLMETSPQIIKGVPIIPILKFHNFLDEFYGHFKDFRIYQVQM